MIGLAEVFACITSDCSTFQPKKDLDEAADEIEGHAGTQFDPDVVRIFLEEVVSKLRDGDIEQYGELTPSVKENELRGFSILVRVDREEPELGKNETLS